MVIDFHTHIFPDRVAPKAISSLAPIIRIEPSMDATRAGLLSSMEQSGIDLSVVLPVITDPHQFDSILRFAAETNELYGKGPGLRLCSFAGIHPESSDYREQIRQVRREGIPGIKLHPYFQGHDIDDPLYLRIIEAASEESLIIVTHAGFDPIAPDRQMAGPDMLLNVIREVRPSRFVLAHMGNNRNHDECLEKLCGQDVFFDTSFSVLHTPAETLLRLIKAHGTDKVLFATDAPWTGQKEALEQFLYLDGLSGEEKQQILSGNASSLLSLPT